MNLGEKLRDLVVHGKDLGASAMMEHAAEKPLSPYGKLMDLSMDSRERKIKIEIFLKGDSAVTVFNVEEYELVEENNQTFFVARKAAVSKEWINALVQEFLIGRKLPLPAKYARLIKLVL